MRFSDQMRESLDRAPERPLPEWMLERVRLMRYPTVWEGAMTTVVRSLSDRAFEAVLVQHVNAVLGDVLLTAAVAREHLAHVDLRFETRADQGPIPVGGGREG